MTEPASGPVPSPASLSEPFSETELAGRFWERIRCFATRRVRDSALAEDVAQETLRRVTEALRAGRVENLAALPGFVFQTARHICLQHHRSAGREDRALGRLGRDPRPSGESDPLLGLISEDRRRAVRAALGRLSADERELLELLYFRQEETSAVAERLGITPGALRVRKHRALQRLAGLLDLRVV
jgi:RNA polymerase sigma-70 factor (ECF subfamily)